MEKEHVCKCNFYRILSHFFQQYTHSNTNTYMNDAFAKDSCQLNFCYCPIHNYDLQQMKIEKVSVYYKLQPCHKVIDTGKQCICKINSKQSI